MLCDQMIYLYYGCAVLGSQIGVRYLQLQKIGSMRTPVPIKLSLRWQRSAIELLSTLAPKSEPKDGTVESSYGAAAAADITVYPSWSISISSSSCASPWNMLSISLKTSSTSMLGVGDVTALVATPLQRVYTLRQSQQFTTPSIVFLSALCT